MVWRIQGSWSEGEEVRELESVEGWSDGEELRELESVEENVKGAERG